MHTLRTAIRRASSLGHKLRRQLDIEMVSILENISLLWVKYQESLRLQYADLLAIYETAKNFQLDPLIIENKENIEYVLSFLSISSAVCFVSAVSIMLLFADTKVTFSIRFILIA